MVIIDNTGDINSFIHGFYEAIIFEVNSSEQEPLEDSISTLQKAIKGKMIPVVAIGVIALNSIVLDGQMQVKQ